MMQALRPLLRFQLFLRQPCQNRLTDLEIFSIQLSGSSHFQTVSQSKAAASHLPKSNGVAKKNPQRFSPARDRIRPVSDRLLKILTQKHKLHEPPQDSSSQSTEILPTMSAEELVDIVRSQPRGSLTTSQLAQLQQLLVKRLREMPLSLMLRAGHGFYLHQHDFAQFMCHAFCVIQETFDDLQPSPSQVTQLLFYVFVIGDAPAMLFHQVEAYLLEHLDRFDINDLAFICGGFFRGNAPFVSMDLIDRMAEKLLREVDSLSPPMLMDFLKMIRHAVYTKTSFYQRLADYLVESGFIYDESLRITTVMHVAFTFASIGVTHTPLFEALLSRVETLAQARKIRSKDISKFVWACGTLQFRPENYEERYGRLVSVVESQLVEDKRHYESCAELLMGLTYLGMFPESLLNLCLSRNVVARLQAAGSDREKYLQLLLLNETVRIECPQYKGNTLTRSQVKAMEEQPSLIRDQQVELHSKPGFLAVLASLQRSLGQEKVQRVFPAVHFRNSILELHYDPQKGFQEMGKASLNEQPSHTSRRHSATQVLLSDHALSALGGTPPISSPSQSRMATKRLAVLVSNINQYALNDPSHRLGHLHTMKRQLCKAGYTVVEIDPIMAKELEVSPHEERCQRLSALFSSALEATITLS